MTKFYQIIARGNRNFFSESQGCIVSRKIFAKKDQAELYLPKFKRLATSPSNEHDLLFLRDDTSLKVTIIEVEIDD